QKECAVLFHFLPYSLVLRFSAVPTYFISLEKVLGNTPISFQFYTHEMSPSPSPILPFHSSSTHTRCLLLLPQFSHFIPVLHTRDFSFSFPNSPISFQFYTHEKSRVCRTGMKWENWGRRR